MCWRASAKLSSKWRFQKISINFKARRLSFSRSFSLLALEGYGKVGLVFEATMGLPNLFNSLDHWRLDVVGVVVPYPFSPRTMVLLGREHRFSEVEAGYFYYELVIRTHGAGGTGACKGSLKSGVIIMGRNTGKGEFGLQHLRSRSRPFLVARETTITFLVNPRWVLRAMSHSYDIGLRSYGGLKVLGDIIWFLADLVVQQKYVFILNGGAVDWKSAKQSIFATSFVKAEYIAAYDASKEAVWVRKFISGLGVVPTIEEPIIHYLREVIEFGDIKLEKVHTNDNLADPFTKALAFPKHSEHTRNIGMLPADSLM
ncbi:hypothetical protein Tco_0173533 [Tanacetum coccineum]